VELSFNDGHLIGIGISAEHLNGRLGEAMKGACEGIVDSHLLGVHSRRDENDVPIAALRHIPSFVFVFAVVFLVTDSVGETGKEDIESAKGGGVVRVGTAAAEPKGREGGHVRLYGKEERAEDRGRVEVAEAATEGGGGTDGAEESGAGESGADEAGEGGQTEEYLAQEVVAEGEYGGRSGLSGFLLPRRQCTRGHGGGGGGGRAQEATGKEGLLVSAQGG
jgi:hypothetical protein